MSEKEGEHEVEEVTEQELCLLEQLCAYLDFSAAQAHFPSDGATSRGRLKKTASHGRVHREIESGQCPNLDFCSQVSLGCAKLVIELTKTDINTDNAMIFYQEVVKLLLT